MDSPDIELAVATSLSMLESTKEKLEKADIQQMVYEDFYDEFVHLIQFMVDPNLDTKKKKAVLLTAFQNHDGILIFSYLFNCCAEYISSVSNSIVMYLRLLTVNLFSRLSGIVLNSH